MNAVISSPVAAYAFGENPRDGIHNLVIIEVLTSIFNCMFFYFSMTVQLVTLLTLSVYIFPVLSSLYIFLI